MLSLKCSKIPRPQLRIVVTGSGMDEETILKIIAWRSSVAKAEAMELVDSS